MSTPRLSVMLFPFHRGLTEGSLSGSKLAQGFDAAGIAGLEPALQWAETQPGPWGELRRAAADLGMAYSCCDVGVNLVGESPADRLSALDTVSRGVEFCRELGCPVALLAGSRPAPGMSNEEGRWVLAEALAAAAARAEGSGVILTIEDFGVYPAFTASAAHVREVVEGAGRPDLKVTFDNGNFLFADERPTDAYALLKERIVHVHVKDYVMGDPTQAGGLRSLAGKRPVGAEIGVGVAEVADCLALLLRDGYAGWVSLEVGTTPPTEAAAAGARFVRDAWARLTA